MKLIFNFAKGFVPLQKELSDHGVELLNNLWELPATEKVDAAIVDFHEAARYPLRSARLKRQLNAIGAPLIGIDRDAPWHKGLRPWRLSLFKLLGGLDIYAAHSLQSAGRFAPIAVYFPNAAWLEAYNLNGVELAAMRQMDWYHHDVSFIGNLDGQHYPEHARRVAFFDALGSKLSARGISYYWADSAHLSTAGQVELIQKSRINLNYGAACDDGPERSWGLPERCYGIPACGGFLLSDNRKHAGDDFEGGEWADFTDVEDCVEKIRYHLAHFDQTRDLAESAHRRVHRDHTYAQRAVRMLSLVRDWQQRRGAHE